MTGPPHRLLQGPATLLLEEECWEKQQGCALCRNPAVRILHGLYLGNNGFSDTLRTCGDVWGTCGDGCAQVWGHGGGQCVAEHGKALPVALTLWNFTVRGAVRGMAILGVEGCGEPQM